MGARFEQRKAAALRNPNVAAGYAEMDAELRLLEAINHAREALGVNQTDLADKLGKTQSAVSQFFSGSYSVTLDAVTACLKALHLQARVEIVRAEEDEPALVVSDKVA